MSREFKVKGRYHQNTLRLRLRITDSEGTTRTIEFPFDVDSDTAESVADEMVEELSLTPDDRKTIVEEIGKEVDVFLPQIRRRRQRRVPRRLTPKCHFRVLADNGQQYLRLFRLPKQHGQDHKTRKGRPPQLHLIRMARSSTGPAKRNARQKKP